MAGFPEVDPVAGTPTLRDDETTPGIRRFLAGQGLADVVFRRVQTGRNNKVWVIESSRGRRVLKQYRSSSTDTRNRLEVEYKFLELLYANGIECVPQPLADDRNLNLALYSFLPGTPVSKITRNHIHQSVEFVGRVNRLRDDPASLAIPAAADACFSVQDHLNSVRTRVERLLTLEALTPLHEEVGAFARAQLGPVLDRVEAEILTSLNHCDMEKPLVSSNRVLSPSDFGFHNALESKGVIHFLDFEYAGWDDPSKLTCDFVCQPDHPLDLELARLFVKDMCTALGSTMSEERVESLLPLHRLKWCCIIMNGFRGMEWSRFSSSGAAEVDVLRSQFLKASAYFDEHLAQA